VINTAWPGNTYLVIWKVGATLTFANENEEQLGGFAGRIFKGEYNRKIAQQ